MRRKFRIRLPQELWIQLWKFRIQLPKELWIQLPWKFRIWLPWKFRIRLPWHHRILPWEAPAVPTANLSNLQEELMPHNPQG
ncbi:hypothetical protein HGM15179_020464 [Zosterops borbonicus]|uniref:Uncharacterized protein n=1 Tax=Zosterops borbonicus TaxID=364589 RepID=A0A8K1D957_9PASS|nr:hypothetical protein HGM15179_020464 [Zosterops borbonicus]